MNTPITIVFDGGKWPDLRKDDKVVHLVETIDAAVLSNPTVLLRFNLPNGTVAFAEVDARRYCEIAVSIMDRYPNLFT